MWEAFPYLAGQHACLPQKPWLAAPAALLQDSALVFIVESVPKRCPFYSSHLANGYLLMTEDELRIIITWNGELTWMPCLRDMRIGGRESKSYEGV